MKSYSLKENSYKQMYLINKFEKDILETSINKMKNEQPKISKETQTVTPISENPVDTKLNKIEYTDKSNLDNDDDILSENQTIPIIQENSQSIHDSLLDKSKNHSEIPDKEQNSSHIPKTRKIKNSKKLSENRNTPYGIKTRQLKILEKLNKTFGLSEPKDLHRLLPKIAMMMEGSKKEEKLHRGKKLALNAYFIYSFALFEKFCTEVIGQSYAKNKDTKKSYNKFFLRFAADKKEINKDPS